MFRDFVRRLNNRDEIPPDVRSEVSDPRLDAMISWVGSYHRLGRRVVKEVVERPFEALNFVGSVSKLRMATRAALAILLRAG
jgi:hypothetical protein